MSNIETKILAELMSDLRNISSTLEKAQTGLGVVIKDVQKQLEEPEQPVCAIHHIPMVEVQGRKGLFWSCHQRGSDGRFCNYRPSGQ